LLHRDSPAIVSIFRKMSDAANSGNPVRSSAYVRKKAFSSIDHSL